jgi:hypothetical protein
MSAGNSTVEGLDITNWGGNGLVLQTNGGDTVKGNFIGVTPTGNATAGNGTVGGAGLAIAASSNNVVGGLLADRNIISGNFNTSHILANGIVVSGQSSGNTIMDNYIGTDATGKVAGLFGNSGDGILIRGGANANVITTANGTPGNAISGNLGNGIEIMDPGSDSNRINGNLIGITADATNTLANGLDGIRITSGNDTVIGGTQTSERNVISGNSGNGIEIVTASGTWVTGNYIGLQTD